MMRMKLAMVTLVLFVGAIATAQSYPPSTLVLGYAEPGIAAVVVLDASGRIQPTIEGKSIPEGGTIRTGAGGFAELQLEPEGTWVRLASETTVQLASLRNSADNSSNNRLELVSGMIRVVMPPFPTIGARGITVGTPATTIWTRGGNVSDFAISVDRERGPELLYVSRDFVNLGINSTGVIVVVVSGMAADSRGDVLEASAVDPVLRSRYLTELQFQKLDEQDLEGPVD